MKEKTISGFSKLSKRGKIKWIVENFFKDPENVMRELKSYWLKNEEQQKIFDGFSENTISNFYLPFGVAPNFVINGKTYCVPMVIEESSVVAAASAAAKFWMKRGGFHAKIINTEKIGQVHFKWKGDFEKLLSLLPRLKKSLIEQSSDITANMEKRGGGVKDIELINFSNKEEDLYQLRVSFDTCDSMGANFINSVLERFAVCLTSFFQEEDSFDQSEKEVDIIMSILSNYTPQCLVEAWVECPISALGEFSEDIDAQVFAKKFKSAIDIAHIDPYRATTHNKGIFNGVDAVVLATGNDFRAVEACGHAYAAKDGQYKSLSHCSIENNVFRFWLEIPLALGTIGGLTSLHPIAKRSLELLENPDAEDLMKIVACLGLAQNFAAIRSLITTGIQQGHMKMHLSNILNQLEASEEEMNSIRKEYADKVVSVTAVKKSLEKIRQNKIPTTG